ncbi:hypothetical protein L1887_56650 [Cichorium endivia]|nr:hypothetical protein L1887_56650 [Cichorium endivia]
MLPNLNWSQRRLSRGGSISTREPPNPDRKCAKQITTELRRSHQVVRHGRGLGQSCKGLVNICRTLRNVHKKRLLWRHAKEAAATARFEASKCLLQLALSADTISGRVQTVLLQSPQVDAAQHDHKGDTKSCERIISLAFGGKGDAKEQGFVADVCEIVTPRARFINPALRFSTSMGHHGDLPRSSKLRSIKSRGFRWLRLGHKNWLRTRRDRSAHGCTDQPALLQEALLLPYASLCQEAQLLLTLCSAQTICSTLRLSSSPPLALLRHFA